ncbi:MAG: hypothetical protein RLZZ262_909 [Bacteroidota bacterium]|jgi:hypothetical protein
MYDPVLGKWHAPDPLSQFHSPYLANFNNPANFVDPDGRSCGIGEAIRMGFSMSGFDFEAAISLVIEGIQTGEKFKGFDVALGVGGTLVGILSVGLTIKDCIDGQASIMEASMNEVVQSASAGAGDWSSKIINGGHNIYRYAGYVSLSYEKKSYITYDLGDKAYFEDLLFDLFEKTSAYEKLVTAQKQNGYTDIYFCAALYDKDDRLVIDRDTGEEIPGQGGDTADYGTNGVTNIAYADVPDPLYKKMVQGSRLSRTSISIRYNLDYIDALNDFANMEKTFENMKKFELALEMALHSLMHEVNAHAIRDINGTCLTESKEHGLYNHDHWERHNSPAYISIPLDGKSQSSKDKIEVQRIVRQYMSQWKK